MSFTNNYELKNERLRTKTPEKPEPIRIPDNLVIFTGQFWKQVQDDRMVKAGYPLLLPLSCLLLTNLAIPPALHTSY
ncbi:MAG: hypothetical protein LBK53_07500 [Heliobacteriaceae bacterium]|jgi:hypothetical protein|nr:hypothetical protein [Heliobacteriaceae bacterium]